MQQLLHGGRLIVAVFQQQPAARPHPLGRLGDKGADVVQPVCATGQRLLRLVPQGLQMRVVLADVGWVADEQIKLPGAAAVVGKCLEPVAVRKLHGQLQALRVMPGKGQGICAVVACPHAGLGRVVRQGAGQRAAARALVGHGGRGAKGGDEHQRPFQ